MSALVKLNLLNEFGKRDKIRGLFSILQVKRMIKYRSTNVRFNLSYDIKITLKLQFWCENVKILSLCMHFFYVCIVVVDVIT